MTIRHFKLTLLSIILLGWALPAAGGGLVGQCADCHTMHNSEQGAPVARVGTEGAISDTPLQNLLRMDCIACHAQGSGERIVSLPGGSKVPQVYHNDPAGDLAAGNFAYISGTKDGHQGSFGNRKGHNVVDVVNADSELAYPPGFRHAGSGGIGAFSVEAFTCAGSMGCHGFRGQLLAVEEQDCDPVDPDCVSSLNIYRTGLNALSGYEGEGNLKRGAHHSNFEGLKMGQTSPEFEENPLAGSYRFLHSVRGLGNEQDRWQNIDENSHNEYFGIEERTTNFNTSNCNACHFGGTVSATYSRIYSPWRTTTGFCLTCHGNFHSTGMAGPGNGSSGAFLRHPSDYVIPDAGEYAVYTAYNVTAPVARPLAFFTEGTGPSAEVSPGEDMVMCLSCHQAHATPYDGMLRFDYNAMVAGGNTEQVGCLACHTVKGVPVAER
ncbi:cytochrome c3 family protein [Desulfurivibrio alkaliphilus]|uniref:Doubled CXXCH motif domain-containing protein n=1 Tax=Desulfurivibrio alkaliphilus (strain DSM 19089 / UNIQEM U267 / AHT2) TaxID=589865 RepID=D6YZV3_DESAT|nr:cytochrome c3 family protein [Desulfurivibrio alkaliphilus]ADH85110.1 hypothetical protein DaAHT2_0404 [Desulfurivibrio alkaliphilus AHT 2]